ncbi:TetR/AcrR family transcriptional regulator [Sphingobium sp.]|uniref:TetR/AcrR family transcriptional regulator n=1 Tax=Sphingobium sp. TaxID=1912891 RepID=UPI0028BD2836|nr:TetR/AcrR family transcriptional regulator [Sphingobium sp.]
MASDPDERGGGRRRTPRQRRSRATVDWIKQATLEIAATEGFGAVTTVRVAERAGVSVGSLYQYFATREAILMALYEDTSIRFATSMRKLVGDVLEMPVEDAVRYGATSILAGYAQNKLVLLDLIDAMPELHLEWHPVSYENIVRGAVKAFVANTIGSVTPSALDRAVFFTERVMMDSIRAYLRAPPPNLSKRALIDDIALMLGQYLAMFATRELRNNPSPA